MFSSEAKVGGSFSAVEIRISELQETTNLLKPRPQVEA
jgi:hypothetical protein